MTCVVQFELALTLDGLAARNKMESCATVIGAQSGLSE